MTSKKSSLNPFRFTYLRNIKGKWPVGVSVFIIIAVNCWEIFSVINQYNYAIKNNLVSDPAILKNEYKFIFNSYANDSEIDWLFFEILLLFLAGILAIILFKYLLNKAEVNVTFSLGISRKKFFLAKYLAGATILSAGVILPMLVACVANVCFFGNSSALWISAGYISLKIISAMMWIFTCFALTMTLVGSVLETFIMGAVVTLSPAFISRICSALTAISANGSPYSFNTGLFSYFGGLVDMKGEPINTDITILDFSKYLTPMSADLNESVLYLPKNVAYDRPYVFFSLVFLAAIIALAVLSALIVAKRPAEKAGFMGTSPVLQGFCVLTVGPWLGTLCVEIAKEGNLTTYRLLFVTFIIASLIIMAVGYSVVDLICIRSFKKYRSRIKYLLIECAIFAVLVGAFATVANIRYATVPKTEDVKSVSVSVSNAYAYSDMAYMRMGFYDGDSGTRLDELLSTETIESVLIEDITDSDVIGKVIAMNKELKKCNNQKAGNVYNVSGFGNRVIPSRIMIIYTLRNGKQVKRAYNRMTDEMLMTVSDDILTTEQARETAAYRLRSNVTRGYDIAYVSPNGSSFTLSKAFSHNGMTPIKPGYYSEGEEEAIVSENKAQKELYNAIALDILDGTLPLNMKSDEEIMGYIYNTSMEETDLDEIDMITLDTSSLFPVYPSMKNTLAVLEKYGEKDVFENTAHPVRITYTTYNSDTDFMDSENAGMVGSMRVDKVGKNGEIVLSDGVVYQYDGAFEGEYVHDYRVIKMGEKTVTVTDPEEIAEIEKTVCFRSLTRYGGYYARMDYEDGYAVFCYIPSYNLK